MIFKAPQISAKELDVIQEIDSLKKRLSYLLHSSPQRWYGLLSRMTLSRAIRGSNTIEGLNITKDDAAAVVEGEEPFDEKTEAWTANECYRRAMTYVLQVANDPYFKYSEAMVKSLHFMMLEYALDKMPGQWRPGYISVVNDETREIVYVGPDAEQVPILMGELIDSLVNMDKDSRSIVNAAMAHLNLTMIHPFKDGNGRMARCLQTLVIVRDGTSAAQFCSIEEFLGNSRNVRAYYDVLALVGGGKWQPDRDALPWIRFCLNAHFIQAKTMLRRTDEMGKVWTELEEEVARKGLPKRTIFALSDGAFGYRIRNIRYRKVADVEDQTASRDLKRLVDLGLLVPQGEARGRFYVASDYIKNIREKHREKQEIEPPLKTS
ncbi:MAG: Fic family protein [Candidatus Omnitrophica bacterium]|nr:Fic family protein [Candidatus Omnitrophota bacterium]